MGFDLKDIKCLLWKPRVRALFNRMGIDVLPSHYYSAAPQVSELESSFEYNRSEPPYADCGLFDDERLKQFLLDLMPYSEEFDPPAEGKQRDPETYFWNNTLFSGSDAMAYYCMVRHLRPRRILEVGCGLSTLVAAEGLARNGSGELICIEPRPKAYLRRLPAITDLMEKKVQDVPVQYFLETLGDDDILFIDGTHVVKTGSDVVYLYLKVLPKLGARVMIHAHDIFIPEAYPKLLLNMNVYWTEQYLLQALLTGNPAFRVCFAAHYSRIHHEDMLTRFMHGCSDIDGGSFWFQKV